MFGPLSAQESGDDVIQEAGCVGQKTTLAQVQAEVVRGIITKAGFVCSIFQSLM